MHATLSSVGDPRFADALVDTVTSASATSRREFLVLASLSGAALVLQSCRSPLPPDATGATGATAAAGAFRPDLWLSILPDGSVEFAVTRLEMGQGIRTGLTILVAEELAMAPERIRLRSPTTAELPEAGVILETGSSDSTSDHWVPLREAAAAAREMLVAAAAARWQVEPGACALADGRVVLREGARDVRGVRSVRSIGIGELAAEAARLPVPKRPRPRAGAREFRFIGKPTRRLEGPEIVTGKPRYAADVRLENQLYAVLCRPPVTGGRARGFDPAPALAVPGVRPALQPGFDELVEVAVEDARGVAGLELGAVVLDLLVRDAARSCGSGCPRRSSWPWRSSAAPSASRFAQLQLVQRGAQHLHRRGRLLESGCARSGTARRCRSAGA